MDELQWLADRFEGRRSRLRAVAYRVLGSLTEADDAVQETWLRFTTNNEAEIRELIDRFAKAFRTKDVKGVMSVFAPEITSFDILPPLEAAVPKRL